MKLIIEDDEGRKTVVPIQADSVTIGRQDGNTVTLKDRNVSRKHAALSRQNGSVVIEDLNSFNGVRINGDRIQGRTQVNEGDLIQIGDYDLAIEREVPETIPERRTEPTMGAVRAPGYRDASDRPTLQIEGGNDLTPTNINDQPPRTSNSSTTAVIKSPFGPGGELNFDGVPVPVAERPRLVVLTGGDRGNDLELGRSVMSIGRSGGPADLQIDHRSISKLHAKIALDSNGSWRVTDLKSANGMRVNGEEYGETPLKSGDILEFGHVQLRFVGAGEKYTVGASSRSRVVAIGATVGAVAVVAGLVLALKPSKNDETVMLPPPSRPAPALAPLPSSPAPAPAALPAPTAAAAAAEPPDEPSGDTERASAAVQQAKQLVRQRKWDRADEKLREAEEVDADDPTVVRLRKEIDSARDHEAVKEAAPPPVKVAHVDRRPKARPADPTPVDTEAAAVAPPAANSKADRRGKARQAYEEAIQAISGQDYVGALAKLERAADLDPTLAEAQKGMGICYAKLHQPDKGAFHYEQYLKLTPHARDADDVRKMLQEYYKQKGD